MSIDKQRIAAVKTLEALGYTWEGGQGWKPPLTVARAPPLGERDLELLSGALIRHFSALPGYSTAAARFLEEIKGWGWFR
jgi:hypothetical protein